MGRQLIAHGLAALPREIRIQQDAIGHSGCHALVPQYNLDSGTDFQPPGELDDFLCHRPVSAIHIHGQPDHNGLDTRFLCRGRHLVHRMAHVLNFKRAQAGCQQTGGVAHGKPHAPFSVINSKDTRHLPGQSTPHPAPVQLLKWPFDVPPRLWFSPPRERFPMTLRLHLKKGRDIPVLRGHPWVMSGAVARWEGDASLDEADILSAAGAFLGRATVHPASEIRARLFSTTPGEVLDEDGLRARLLLARDRRRRWLPGAEACRLVFSESDGLPGLIVDRYGPVLVLQVLTAPMERRRTTILRLLQDLLEPVAVFERSDVDVRRHEALEPRKGWLAGTPPALPLAFRDGDLTFMADIESGHKTGFYLDQQRNRQSLVSWVARLDAPRVLNVFAYTDAFGVAALKAGAGAVLSVDSSTGARELALRQHQINGTAGDRLEYRLGDAFETLRDLRGRGERFDLIVLDPPRLVSGRQRLHAGLRGYKDLNLQALQLLQPQGILFTFSCSGLVDRELFGKVIEGAARDARRPACLLESLGQPPDHPRKPGFAESEYLKGFVVGV